MMKILSTLTASCLLLFGCDSQPRKSNTAENIPSTEDSAFRIKRDSTIVIEEKIAFGDIKFGINEKQFAVEKDKYLKSTERKIWKDSDVTAHRIGDYAIWNVDGFFENDSLYMVEIRGNPIDWTDYAPKAQDQFNSIMEVLTTRYGSPHKRESFPNWTQIDDGYHFAVTSWVFGKKRIELRVANSRNDYQINIASFLPDVRQKIKERDKANAIKQVEEDAKKL